MDYSQFQVKYINTPVINSTLPDIDLEIPLIDIGNISYLNGEADKPTSIIEQEQKPLEVVRKPITNKVVSPKFKASKGLNNFNFNFNEALKVGGTEALQLQSRRALLTHLALMESSFNSSVLNKIGAPAYGYFLFMLGNYRGKNYNNIGLYAGVDIDTFRNSPVLLIRAANKLANSFINSFSKSELQRLHNLGWTDNAIIAGAWLGGPGGVRAFAFSNKDRSDGSTTVGRRMRQFNY